LTSKNLTLIRQVLTEGIWSEVVSLPNALMRQARADQAHAPVKAAVTAQLAVAIAILSFAPVRLTNLVSIELDKNLIKPGGPNSPFWLVFPHYDVKNRVNLEFAFDEDLSGLIDEYIHDFRPTLLRRSNAAWLFPGVAGEPKTANMFSTQIKERIQKATGLRMTVHQFRHACAAIYLKHRPGEYEVVRRLLAHCPMRVSRADLIFRPPRGSRKAAAACAMVRLCIRHSLRFIRELHARYGCDTLYRTRWYGLPSKSVTTKWLQNTIQSPSGSALAPGAAPSRCGRHAARPANILEASGNIHHRARYTVPASPSSEQSFV
jgi:hypothetical protein